MLDFPSVADKTFLITIGDRSVGGQVAREQMVGPWQVPVADVGVVADGYRGKSGQAIAIGERAPLAVIDAAAAARIAVGEAITNIAAARIENIGDIKLSANWMAAAGEAGHDADLYDAVRATTKLCSQLGLSIPVGKDSMAMKTIWHDNARHADGAHKVVAPLSLVVTAFAPVADIGATATPQLSVDGENAENDLWLIDLARGKNRLGGSVLAQVHGQIGNSPPDVDDAKCLKNFFGLIQSLNRQGLLLAYHDRADGGLLATLCEMAFAARCGLRIDFAPGDLAGDDALAVLALLFGEELGAVIQTARARRENIAAQIRQFELDDAVHRIGHAVAHDDAGDEIVICTGAKTWLQTSRAKLHKTWSQTSFRMQSLRDNPDCAVQEYARIEAADGGLFSRTAFDHKIDIAASFSHRRPKIAVLREQGINGQLEMAAAFDCAGFDAVDVTMSDLNELGAHSLADYRGFVACGGFSFGDVLGAGEGWAKSILYNPRLREMFGEFFARNDTFALGVCNGCQMMAAIAELIPGAEHWPTFVDNHSAQFEARTVMVEICSDKSIFFRGMKNAKLPIVTAHGEGRARFAANHRQHLEAAAQICLRFIDHAGNPTETYPANPNGSPAGATGFTNADGRFTILMPHPERVIRAVCNSWRPHRENNWGEYSPWIQMFRNARVWVG